MDKIKKLRDRVKNFGAGLKSGVIMREIIMDNEPYICDLNAETQLFDNGENSLGVSIMDYAPYSPVTIQIKKAKGQPYNRVTLRDEGDFEQSFFVEADFEKFQIFAADGKTEDLIRKYGSQILGLTYESKKQLTWEYIFPDLLSKAKKEIYG